jgi:hypothetical protein
VVTASGDHTARLWDASTLPIHMGPIHIGSLVDWRLLARGSPFVFVDGVLTSNPDPLRMYPRH